MLVVAGWSEADGVFVVVAPAPVSIADSEDWPTVGFQLVVIEESVVAASADAAAAGQVTFLGAFDSAVMIE